jgi:hypothetical protein
MADAESQQSVLAAGASRSVTTIEDELGRQDQALLDLSHSRTVAVSLVHCSTEKREAQLVRRLAARARAQNFVTAQVSLLEVNLDTFEQLVRTLAEGLFAPGAPRPGGLLQLLDRYWERRGTRAALRFQEAAEAAGAEGDLKALCHAYLEADGEARSEIRAYHAWLDGTEPGKRSRNPQVRAALNPQTAQRALGELSRIMVALGYSGLAIYLHDGDAVTRRTTRQREKAYTVLRELVDNFDTGNGAVGVRILITGTERLFEGARSLASLAPLLARLEIASDAEPPPPHRSWTSLVRDPYEYVHRRAERAPDAKRASLRTLIRISQGLPPLEAVTSMSVGHERIDRDIDRLFEHADASGSVFTALVGDYGSGKTHLLMHLAERALADGHPVFWLNLERLNLDLGNPARHFQRLLEHSVLPLRRRPTALEQASRWTRSAVKLRSLCHALGEIACAQAEVAVPARKALQIANAAAEPGTALESFLIGRDLRERSAAKGYRQDAYRRLLLWLELLAKLEGCRGPVVLIDEAENLYTTGSGRTARRAALRSLAFYCGGALPNACVVIAITPPALAQLRREARELLGEVDEQSGTLEWEDAPMFKRRLQRLEPELVPALSKKQRYELAELVRSTHRGVRGPIEFEDWERRVKDVVREHHSPRAVIRTLVDELEASWWAGN